MLMRAASLRNRSKFILREEIVQTKRGYQHYMVNAMSVREECTRLVYRVVSKHRN